MKLPDFDGTSWFTRIASRAAHLAGQPVTFVVAVGSILLWAMCGPFFRFSDTWQLVVNTSTTIITFLMVFLIQNSQNRDSKALQLKLDELIRATESANNALLDLEELDERELDKVRDEFEALARRARDEQQKRQTSSDV